MKHLIDLVAEINQRIEDYKSHKIDDSYHDGLIFALEDLRDDFINTLEAKEADLDKEIDRYYNIEVPKEFEEVLYEDIEKFAKHFFELGISVNNSTKVTTPDVDNVLKENGVNPDSKEAKIIKESYFMAIEKLAQKGK